MRLWQSSSSKWQGHVWTTLQRGKEHIAKDPPGHLSKTLLPRPHAAGHDPGTTHAAATSSACRCLRCRTLALPLAPRPLGGPPLFVGSQALGGVICQILVMVLQARRSRPGGTLVRHAVCQGGRPQEGFVPRAQQQPRTFVSQ